jgi:hypothetical protein
MLSHRIKDVKLQPIVNEWGEIIVKRGTDSTIVAITITFWGCPAFVGGSRYSLLLGAYGALVTASIAQPAL